MMKTSLRVGIASACVVGLFWFVLTQRTYLVLPFVALLFAVLMTGWMGSKCLEGNEYSFFWFIGVCALVFLVPAVLWTYVSGDQSLLMRRILTSLGMLIFAFLPRGENNEDDQDDIDEDDVDEDELSYTDTLDDAEVSEPHTVSHSWYDAPAIQQQSFDHAGVSFSPDDLKKIEGIGPSIEQLLYDAGITTYGHLAAASYEYLQTVLVEAGSSFAMHDPFTWADQAALARDGQWNQLHTFQELLHGGTHA